MRGQNKTEFSVGARQIKLDCSSLPAQVCEDAAITAPIETTTDTGNWRDVNEKEKRHHTERISSNSLCCLLFLS